MEEDGGRWKVVEDVMDLAHSVSDTEGLFRQYNIGLA